MDLPRQSLGVLVLAGLGVGNFEADLPHSEHLLVVAGGQVHGGVRDPPRVPAPALVDKAHVGEQVGCDVVGGDLAPRQHVKTCLLYTSPSPRDRTRSRMPSSA